MQIETTYTIKNAKHITCWYDLEITSENGEKVIVKLSSQQKEDLGRNLTGRAKEEKMRELELLTESLNPTELIEE